MEEHDAFLISLDDVVVDPQSLLSFNHEDSLRLTLLNVVALDRRQSASFST